MKVSEFYEEKREQPTVKLYDYDLANLKDIDVDDKLTLNLKVRAKSKYHEEFMEGNPLCITFEIVKAERNGKS